MIERSHSTGLGVLQFQTETLEGVRVGINAEQCVLDDPAVTDPATMCTSAFDAGQVAPRRPCRSRW